MKPLRQRPRLSPRRHQILDAALRCFLENGVETTTIEHIRKASGASLGSIYHHFGNKEAIALAVYAEAVADLHGHMTECLCRETTAEAGVRALVAAQLEWMQSHADRTLYLLHVEMADVSPEAASQIADVLQTFFQGVYDWLKPFVESGEIIRVVPALYVPLLLGPSSSYIRHWLHHRLAHDSRDVTETLANAAWNSVRKETSRC